MLEPQQFYFVRHGESDWNVKGLCLGQQDRPLTLRGMKQARRSANTVGQLPIGSVFTSPLSRARDTADILAKTGRWHVHTTPGLAEVHLGAWEGAVESAVHVQLRSWVDGMPPPGGETFLMFKQRVCDATNDCLRGCGNHTPLLVAHAGTFWALAKLVGREVFDPEHCRPYLFKPVAGGWTLQKVG